LLEQRIMRSVHNSVTHSSARPGGRSNKNKDRTNSDGQSTSASLRDGINVTVSKPLSRRMSGGAFLKSRPTPVRMKYGAPTVARYGSVIPIEW